MYYSLFEGKGKRFFRYLLRRESLCFKGMFSLKPGVVKNLQKRKKREWNL